VLVQDNNTYSYILYLVPTLSSNPSTSISQVSSSNVYEVGDGSLMG